MLATTINTMILGFLGFLLQLNHSTATSTRDSVSNYVHHKSSNLDAALRYINNSGVCETTEGVHTASGYIEIAQNQSLVCLYLILGAHPLNYIFYSGFGFLRPGNRPKQLRLRYGSTVAQVAPP